MQIKTVSVFQQGEEAGVVEADDTMDPKATVWWPSESLDKKRYPFYSTMKGRVFLPYIVETDEKGSRHRLLIKEDKAAAGAWQRIISSIKAED